MFFKFYDPRSLPIITCPLPTKLHTNKSLVTASHLVIQQCRENIQKNFLDADMMLSIACYLQWLVYTSHPENKKSTIAFLPEKTWMQSFMKAVKKGVSGEVHLSEALERRLPVAIKILHKNEGLSGIQDFVHEYMVAVHGMNEIRRLVPNFCYTFCMYHSNFLVRLAIEKIEGVQFGSYLNQLNGRAFSVKAQEEFLQIWVQIVLSLEIAQETVFFTHFDLHAENIVIRSSQEELPHIEYPVFDAVYQIEHVKKIATILDFGHSTIRYEKGFVGKTGERAFPQHGMYPFYVAGADLFKLITFTYITFYYRKRFPPDSHGVGLQKFFSYLLLNFYGIQMDHPTLPHYVDATTLANSFYNGTRFPTIYSSPYDMLRFMENQQKLLLTFLGVNQYPWKRFTISPKFRFYKTLKYFQKETYECFQKLFCVPVTSLEKNIYSFTTQHALHHPPSEKEIQTLLQKKIPILDFAHLHDMIEFLKPDDVWKRFIDHVNFMTTQFRQAKHVAPPEFHVHLKYYRAYMTISGYTSYYEQFYKLHY
jgi:hypothetical protein